MSTPGEGLLVRIRLPLAGALVVLAGGFAGFLAFGFGWLEAFSTTLLVVTTVGSAAPQAQGSGEQALSAILALLGVSAYLAILAVAASTLADGRLGIARRRRRMQREIDAQSGHFVLCAYGRVGRTVARSFEAEGIAFVVVETRADLEEQMRADGVRYMVANPTQERVLRAAGIERARGLVCAVDSDADNVFIALTGRSLNPGVFIVARASEAESADRLYRAGANRVISPYVSSGRHMAVLAMRPRVVDYLEVSAGGARRPVRLEELIVDADSPLVGRSLREACGDAMAVLVQPHSGEARRNPDPDYRINGGDLIVLAGDPESLAGIEGA